MTALTGFGLPLTAAQREVWIADQLDPTRTRHNCGGFLDIRGPLRLDLLAAAVEYVVAETDALQVRIVPSGQAVNQQAHSTSAPVQLVDLSETGSAAEAEAAAWNWMRADLARPVEVTSDPLFAHVVLRLAADRHLFYFRYHHI